MNHSLYKTIESFCRTLQPYEVLSALLDITISQFARPGTFKEEYEKAVSLLKNKDLINKFVCDLIKEYGSGTTTEGWCDPWGDTYQDISSKSHCKQLGQFFTPKHICTLTAQLNNPEGTVQNKTILDPACGSGRMLLAAKSLNPNNYFFGEDLDEICCKMTVCNFLFHGCIGEVINHNSLGKRNEFYAGWRIMDYGLEIPILEKITLPEESFICSGNQWFKKFSIVEALEQLLQTTANLEQSDPSDSSEKSEEILTVPEIKNLSGEQLSLF